MVKKKKKKETSTTGYKYIPEERYERAYAEAKPGEKKVLKKIYELQKKKGVKIKAERELGVREPKYKRGLKGLKKAFARVGSKKRVAAKAAGYRRLLSAVGAGATAAGKGAGRPKGTYKYGMPIQQWKKQQTEKRALYAQYQAEQQMKLRRRGLTPQQVAQLQQIRTAEEVQQPQRELPIQPIRRPSQRPQIQRQVKVSNRQGYPQPPPNVADDELRFRKWMADRTVSPNTQRLLTQIRRIQNKGKVDNIEQQRRHWERKLVGSSMNLMRAHENMNTIKLDFTGVNPEENILMAPSVFKENREENILRTNKLNIMQTREAGNNLQFF